jgi:hypothetical protein
MSPLSDTEMRLNIAWIDLATKLAPASSDARLMSATKASAAFRFCSTGVGLQLQEGEVAVAKCIVASAGPRLQASDQRTVALGGPGHVYTG